MKLGNRKSKLAALLTFLALIFCGTAQAKRLKMEAVEGDRTSMEFLKKVLRDAQIAPQFLEIKAQLGSAKIKLSSKSILIGHWLPVNDYVAVSRIKNEKVFYVFEKQGEWFTKQYPLRKFVLPNDKRIETDLIVVQGKNVIVDSVVSKKKDEGPVFVVVFHDDFIFIINMETFSGVSYNRGYH